MMKRQPDQKEILILYRDYLVVLEKDNNFDFEYNKENDTQLEETPVKLGTIGDEFVKYS